MGVPFSISRRQFLKLGGAGFISLLGMEFTYRRALAGLLAQVSGYSSLQENLLQNSPARMLSPDQQGRMLNDLVDLYDIPSFSGKRVSTYYRDQVLPVSEISIGKAEDSFNLVWYKLNNEGYAHSGVIQPVFTRLNQVAHTIPQGGNLGEVTVPFTDARWDPGQDQVVAYRYYYGTTYWVVDWIDDAEGNPWYAVRDDKWDYMFYVPATHLRLVPAEELQPISPQVPFRDKRLEVILPEQVMIAYEYDQPVFVARVATGAIFSNGNYTTPTGPHVTFHKRASRHMARGNLAENGYDLPGVPWNSYITEEGIAFHGTYWHNNFGRPRSHGCINLTPQAAKWVYLWTMPVVPPDQEDVYEVTGTAVNIID